MDNNFDNINPEIYDSSIVSDDMSFGQAFAAAREALGPGGSFTWRGKVYGTYYENEWNAMSPEEQHAFTMDAINGHETHNDYLSPEQPMLADATDDDSIDVSIVGMDTYQIDDQPVNLATLDVNGQEVFMIDLDNDNVFDYAVSDFDGSGELFDSPSDMVDISGEGISLSDLDSGIDFGSGLDLV